MKSTVVRRTALAASAAALTLLATACGGSSDDDGAAGDGKAKADQSAPADKTDEAAPAGKALTAAELEKVALAQADVKNGEVATKIPAADDVAKDQISASDEACLPLVYVQGAIAQGEPAADVKRTWSGQTEKKSEGSGPDGQDMTEIDINKIMLNVASYEDGGAEKALAALSTAAEKCAGGFTATVGSDEMRIAKVTKTTAADSGADTGDEAVAVTIGVATGTDTDASMKAVVVRKGSTLASFGIVNISAMMTGKDFKIPTAVIDAQVAKLG